MKLYATQDVAGTLTALPDPRVAPTSFAVTADTRAASVGAQLDAFLAALGLSQGNGAATAQAAATVQSTPAVVPFYKHPIFLVGAGAGLAYLLLKGR